MGDKKKKKAGGQDEDDSTMQLTKVYRKRCENNGVQQNSLFQSKLLKAQEDGEDLEKLHLFEHMGPVGVRALMEALAELNYKHCKSMRLWKVQAQDEGVRTICNYMIKTQSLEYLDLLDNDIGLLGCEFLGKALHPACQVPLLKLKLDHNEFGTAGLRLLCEGLAMNSMLEKLSLCYCKIDEEGAKYFQEILANVETKLQKLKIQGNLLKNPGLYQIFRAVQVNDMLQKLNIADNQWNLNEDDAKECTKLIIEVLEKNTSLIHYNFKNNSIGDEDGFKIIECIEKNKNLYKVELPDTMSQTVLEKVKNLTKKRKPKKKGKGKKGKGKKK